MGEALAAGLDFGTTNSALAVVGPGGRPRLARFRAALEGGEAEAFRSVLFFEPAEGEAAVHAGPRALERRLALGPGEGRLVQSLKSFLASRLFRTTRIEGRDYRLEELVGLLLGALRREAEAALGARVERAVVGRPVRFVGARDDGADALAERRLRAACHNAGFREVAFEYEPAAAAWHYERELERDALLLIADFGGGTSDFSLLRVGPSFRAGRPREEGVLGHDGVAVAGDAFDGRIVRHAVAPRLGRGTTFRSIFGRELPVPSWIYGHLEQWHHVSFLRAPRTLRVLLDLRREAREPERLDALLHVVEADLGFELYRATERLKRELSGATEAPLRFEAGPATTRAEVARADFEAWIDGLLAGIAGCVDGLLERAAVAPRAVDRVFLTGGSARVPAVRRLFEARFGAERVRGGGELTSVASGLALRAAERGAPAGRR